MIRIENSAPENIHALAAVQRLAYPELDESLWFLPEHYANHIRIFPEGQICLLNPAGDVVGCASSCRVFMGENEIEHTYDEKLGDNLLYKHEPNGEWLYLADMCIRPDHQGQGLSQPLLDEMKHLAQKRGLRGIVFGGVLHGYGPLKDEMSAEVYVEKTKAGKIFDPTLSVYLRRGFEITGIINFYFEAPAYGHKAALCVWKNPLSVA
jgi:ribosomal protein S18 acetylase RimI-like enzyme